MKSSSLIFILLILSFASTPLYKYYAEHSLIEKKQELEVVSKQIINVTDELLYLISLDDLENIKTTYFLVKNRLHTLETKEYQLYKDIENINNNMVL
jgi:hypothetical protein